MKQPNILLIVLDATRADYCSCYNPTLTITPALDRLAHEGVLFERAYASAPWTLPAMSSILTGRYPTETEIETTRVLAPDQPTLPARLKELGYATYAISKNGWFSPAFGLTRDFDEFHRLWQFVQTEVDLTDINLTHDYGEQNRLMSAARAAMRGNWLKNGVNLVSRRLKLLRDKDYGAERTLRPVQRWITAQTGAWFALVHYLEAHLEYKPPVEWARRFVDDWPLAQKLLAAPQWRLSYRHITGVEPLTPEELRVWRQLYTAEVAYQDQAMGQLLEWLRQTRRDADTLVIVVADHGESLGEHGLLNHGYGLSEPLIHVPLVMRGPGAPAGAQVRGLVQTSDLFGTVLAAAGAPLPAHARNLLDASAARSYIVAEYGGARAPLRDLLARYGLQATDFEQFQRSLVAVRTAAHKLITGSDDSVQLYDLARDPGEQVNLAAGEPVLLAKMQGLLGEWRATVGLAEPAPPALPSAPTIAPEVAARLKALGYLD